MRVTQFLKDCKAGEVEYKALKSALLKLERQAKAAPEDKELYLSFLSLKAEVLSRLKRIGENKKEIADMIQKVSDPVCRSLLTYRYISGETFEKIAILMGYDERHIYRLHKKAVSFLEKD